MSSHDFRKRESSPMRPRVERLVRPPFGAAAAAQKSSRGCDPREQPPATDRVVASCRDSGRGLPFPVPLSRHQAAARFPGMRPRLLGRIPGYGLVRLSPHPLDPAFCPVVDTHFRETVLSTAPRKKVSGRISPDCVPRQRHRTLAGGATRRGAPPECCALALVPRQRHGIVSFLPCRCRGT